MAGLAASGCSLLPVDRQVAGPPMEPVEQLRASFQQTVDDIGPGQLILLTRRQNDAWGLGLLREGDDWCVWSGHHEVDPVEGTGSGGAGMGCSSEPPPFGVYPDTHLVHWVLPADVEQLDVEVGGTVLDAVVSTLPGEDGWHLAGVVLPPGNTAAQVDAIRAFDTDGELLWEADRAELPDHVRGVGG